MTSSNDGKINLPIAIIIGMNAMIGAGIFTAPAAIASFVGPAGIVVYLGVAIISENALAKPPADRDSNIDKSMGQTLYLPIAHKDLSYDRGDGDIVNQRIINQIQIRNTDPYNQIIAP